jgi:hypothetical protein
MFDRHAELNGDQEEVRHLITRAYDHILAAETSCNFYWGSRWVHRSFDDVERAYVHLDAAMNKMENASGR